MCVLWHFADYFSELSHRSFSKFKCHILENLRVPFKKIYLFFSKRALLKKRLIPGRFIFLKWTLSTQ